MKKIVFTLLFLLLTYGFTLSQNSEFNGKWKLIKEQSSGIDHFQYMHLDFSVKKGEVTINKELGPSRKYFDKVTLNTDGKNQFVTIKDGTFFSNLYMGAKLIPNEKKEVTAKWENNSTLVVNEKFRVIISQGYKDEIVTNIYELSPNKDLITLKIQRNTRKSDQELKYVFKRYDADNAYVMKLVDDWEISSKLPEQACLISIQGIVNEDKPNLYFIYGPKWDFNYTPNFYGFLCNQKHFSFTELNSLESVISTFKDKLKGYIVWDKKVRISLIVGYTLAGLEKGIVITEELIPLAQKYGLKEIDDFRGRFSGKSDYEIYSWAYDKYWKRCSKETICWLGGEWVNMLKPAIADYAITQKAFCTDLSARATDTLEYKLTRKLFSEMAPLGHIVGWHSYKKDFEEEFTTLSSSHGMTIDGLNTLPNISFVARIPLTPGFKFKNNHSIKPGETYTPQKKVYLSFIQTDGLGLGGWVKPGRGSIPYAWEVHQPSLKFLKLAPVMLEFYYTQATPNDYFIGALGGSSYMYPKIFPKDLLPLELKKAYNFMQQLDLNSYEIMDYSTDGTDGGRNDLTKEVVDVYYKCMPDVIGYVNGYYASHTFTIRDKKPLLPFDYYLSPTKTEDQAVADINELAEMNFKRPYFCLIHVRETSDVARVKSICDKLGSNFEAIPLDKFIKMVSENPNLKERYLDDK
jgi:hypothetical protein